MIQLQLSEYNESNLKDLLGKIRPVLEKRKKLHKKYSREATQSKLLYTDDLTSTKLPFEKYIVDLATGYTSGKPTYDVNAAKDDDTNRLLKSLFDKPERDDDYVKGMQTAIKYISNYNDDSQENYDLVHDLFELTSCYEIIYENEDNEIIYARYSPLQTVATWDYSVPVNLTGLVRIWTETENGRDVEKCELTDEFSTRIYRTDPVSLESEEKHSWGDVPGFAVETDYAIFETCEDLIMAYEQIIQNIRNTYQYNDADCKLKISGYTPEEDATITDSEGNVTINPARTVEDNIWMQSKTIYVGEGGDVSWLSKPIDADGFTKTIKTYQDLMFQLAGIPNTSDLAFNSTDLNTSAIDRKFYIMNMATAKVVSELKKAYLRRWELIFNRINLKKHTNYDFRDIVVEIPKNLPANDDELISSMLKLKGTVSEATILNKLGYDYIVEKQNMEEETTEKLMNNIENMQKMRGSGLSNSDLTTNSLFNSYDTSLKGVEREQMEDNGQTTEELAERNNQNLQEN